MRKLLFSVLFAVVAVTASAQTAHWITVDDSTRNERNTWIEFKKDLTLKKKVKKAETKIAADSKYWLWINGQMVVFEGGLKRGPDKASTYYDVVDIAPYLKKGVNEIQVYLWHFGRSGFSHNSSGQSGLLIDAPAVKLFTDSSWESTKLPEYQMAINPKPNYRLPESNIKYDSRLAGTGVFKPSVEVGTWGDKPWGELKERPIPQWKDYGVKPVEFVKGEDKEGNELLTARLPYNMQFTPVINVTDRGEGTLIRLETDHIMGGSEPCIRAEYVTSNGNQSYESLGWMNGDELRVIYPKDADITVNSLAVRETGYNCEFEGSFTSCDTTINRFWDKAMRTLYVNMRDTYFDCPDRERAQWWGDVTILIGQSFYQLSPEANKLMKKAIHELVDWQRPDSTLYSPIPTGTWKNELPAQMLASISTYGFWYYYVNTGDKATIEHAYPAVKRYLGLWKLDDSGLTAYRKGGWSWGDWGTHIDIRLILASWHYLALQSAINMAELTGNTADIAEYQQIRESIYKAFNECWNGYAYRHPEYIGATDDRIHAMAVLSGLADSSKYDTIYNFFRKQKYASPYMEKYVLEALFKMGHGDFALERFKKRFGPMIADSLHSTLYEGWEEGGYGGGSTNHAWSGGMLTVIAENVCGVRPLEAGWKSFEVCPDPVIPECDILIPSVQGKIHSAFVDTPAEFTLKLSVPAGTKAVVKVPAKPSGEILVNGKMTSGEIILEKGEYEIVSR